MVTRRYYGGRPKAPDPTKWLTQWAGGTLAKSHAMGPRVAEIAEHQARNEITSISIRGREGTGKTTLARVLAHQLHIELDRRAHDTSEASQHERKHREAMRRGYVVKLLTGEHLKNLTATMEALPTMNRILIFDDSSFMGASSSRAVLRIKKELTTIRHTSAGDMKVILIFNFHYSKALDPYLRDTNFVLQTSISGPEMGNMRDLYDEPTGMNMRKLGQFQASTQSMSRHGQATLTLGPGRRARLYQAAQAPTKITYKYSDPFRLATFFNTSDLRIMVYPGAGPDPDPDPLNISECGICAAAAATAEHGGAEPRADPEQVITWLKKQWVKQDMVGAALRGIYIRRHGVDPVHRDRNAAMEIISRLEAAGACRYEDLVKAYFKDTPAADRILGGPGRRAAVSAGKRAAFLHTFGFDGLRRPDETAQQAPTDDEIEAVQEAMR